MKCPIEMYFDGVLTGGKNLHNRELGHARTIHKALRERWNLHHPEQGRMKHLRWFLEAHQKSEDSENRYRYWLTVKKIMKRRQKEADWTPRLQGPWTITPRKKSV